jgi:hypothetical protein
MYSQKSLRRNIGKKANKVYHSSGFPGLFLLPQNTAFRRRTPNITDKRRRIPQNTASPSPSPSPNLHLILVVEEEKMPVDNVDNSLSRKFITIGEYTSYNTNDEV